MGKPLLIKACMLVFVFGISKVDAQWKQLYVGCPGGINTVAIFGSNVFAGANGGIYGSTNDA